MATINDWIKVFGEPLLKGDNMNETTGSIEKRGEKEGKLSIFIAGQWYSQFFNNKNITEDTRKAMESCQIGETWKIGWQAAGDKGQWRNIIVMEREIDVNQDMKQPTPAPSGRTKDEHITNLALWKCATTMFSNTLQIFIDNEGGDFQKGFAEWIAHAKGFFNTLKEDTK